MVIKLYVLVLVFALFSNASQSNYYYYEQKALQGSLNSFLEILSVSQESYEVIFYCLYDNPFDIQFISASLQYRIHSIWSADSFYNDNPLKFTKLFYLVIMCHDSLDNIIHHIAMHPTTLLLVPIRGAKGLKPDITSLFDREWINYPALKVVLFAVASHYHQFQTKYKIVCNGYSSETACTGDNFGIGVMKKFGNPLLAHRQYFRVGNGRKVDALLFGSNRYFEYNEGDSRFCQRLWHSDIRFWLCNENIMSTVVLSAQHNVSFTQLNGDNTSVMRNTDRSFRGQFIISQVWRSNYGENVFNYHWRKTGLVFSRHNEDILIYCARHANGEKERKINFGTWLYPFSCVIWIFSIGAVAAITLTVKQIGKLGGGRLFVHFIDCVGVFLGNSAQQHMYRIRFCVFLQFLGVLVCGFYGNGIMSVLTVPDRVTPFESLDEAFSAGYKIIWDSDEWISPWEAHHGKFQVKRWLDKLNTSFHHLNSDNWTSLKVATLLTREKMRIVDRSNTLKNFLYFKHIIYAELKMEDVECYTLPEYLKSSPTFVEMYTVNRHWMMQTYTRIRGNGLLDKWEHWNALAYRYFQKQSREDPNPNKIIPGEEIPAPDIHGILLICCVFYTLGLIHLLIEISPLSQILRILPFTVKARASNKNRQSRNSKPGNRILSRRNEKRNGRISSILEQKSGNQTENAPEMNDRLIIEVACRMWVEQQRRRAILRLWTNNN